MPEATTQAEPLKTYQCRHLFTDGHRCGAKSLRNEAFCFYHHTTRKPFPKAAPQPPAEAAFDLAFPEDRASIQLSIGEILRRIAANQIDPRRAGLLLYGLQIASCNLPKERAPKAESRNPRRRGRSDYAKRLLSGDYSGEPTGPEPVDTYETDPELGPLAPQAEYTEPEEEPSFFTTFLQQIGEETDTETPPAPIPTLNACAETKSGAKSLATASSSLRVGLTTPKSDKAKRVLRIPQIALNSLFAHQTIQAKAKVWCGKKWQDAGYVFTTSTGTPISPDEVSREFPAVITAAGLTKVRFHDLRHSCASLLLSLGVPAKLVQETLGHSTYQLTMDTYSHMIPALRNEVADRMDEIFSTTVNEAVNESKVAVH